MPANSERMGEEKEIDHTCKVNNGSRRTNYLTRAAPQGRYDLFSYSVVDAYARHFARAGFAHEVRAIRAAHERGDRPAALAAVSDKMLDAINVVGDQALVADTVTAYRRAGVDVPVIFPLTWGAGFQDEALEATLRAAIRAAATTDKL